MLAFFASCCTVGAQGVQYHEAAFERSLQRRLRWGCGIRAGCDNAHLQKLIDTLAKVVGVPEVQRPEVAEEGLVDLVTREHELSGVRYEHRHVRPCMHVRTPQGV